MKKISAFICIYLWLIFFCFNVRAQEFTVVRDGIEHAEMTREIDNGSIKMNLLRLDLSKVRLDVVHAMDAAIGLEKTSSMATRHGAFAAINAGFFRIDKSIWEGDDASALKIDGKILSESFANRISLGILNGKDKTEVDFGHIIVNWEGGYVVGSEIAFDGVNRERKSNEIILYTPEFHRTTLTESNGTEIILGDCAPRCNRAEVIEDKGNSLIPIAGYVVSIGKDAKEKAQGILFYARKKSKKNDDKILLYPHLRLIEQDKHLFFDKAEDIVAGVPQLIKNGEIEITWREEKSSKEFVETRHPRTAVAKLKNGKFLMITVDGRSQTSSGIGLQNLAKILLELGATDAMNLDGGGSTTMFLDGKIVNKPSDKEGERRVGDAILVTPRK